ncbi:MAG TPA: MurT ligase domain-containing protein [Candidatus Acidoferrum sp.]|nr:MurT ligase domain-containing protein [Candidatus Acidoferrum sp.]
MKMLHRARLALAISAGKMAGISGRFFRIGGGTSLPGMVARRIDPNILKSVMSRSSAKKIIITGSNGKTTTARMISAIADAAGHKVGHNRTGSNLLQGVTSVAVNSASLFGKLDHDVLIFEIDEATMPQAVPEIQPDVVVITNIFRDQLDRYGELYSVAAAIDKVLEALPPTATIVLNGNDPQVANFGQHAKAKKLFFGLETLKVGTKVPEQSADVIRCIRCNHDLLYEVAYLSHLGIYHCPNCGYELPKLDVSATDVTLAKDGEGPSQLQLRLPNGKLAVTVVLPGLHNVYNATAAIAAGLSAGLSLDNVQEAFNNVRTAFGRLEKIKADDKTVYLSFVKNPTSFNLVMRLIAQHPGKKQFMFAFSRTLVDGEDFAWLWDVDIEEIASQVSGAICSGNKAEEIALRLKYAEVPVNKLNLITDLETALDAGLANVKPGGTVYILCGYTPTHELRRIMQKRGWVKHFWEE